MKKKSASQSAFFNLRILVGAEGADDFQITDPEGWTISQFNFNGSQGAVLIFPRSLFGFQRAL